MDEPLGDEETKDDDTEDPFKTTKQDDKPAKKRRIVQKLDHDLYGLVHP